jgi:hypothetical protein
LRNDGSGNFQVQSPQPTTLVGTATAAEVYTTAGDLNGDGLPDLVIASAENSTGGVQVLLNTGTGTFTTSSSLLGGYKVRGPAIADIDDKNLPDIILASEFPSYQAIVLLNSGQGTFTSSGNGSDVVAVPTSGIGRDVVTYDSDGNGYPDILVSLPASAFGLPRVSVIENQGALQINVYDLIASARTGRLRLADVNGDNLPDLMTTAEADGLGIFLSRADTGISEAQPLKHATGCAGNAQNFVAADFNQDGRTDLAVQAPSCFKLLLNQSN